MPTGAITGGQLLQALSRQAAEVVTGEPARALGERLKADAGISAQVVSAALQRQTRQRRATDRSRVELWGQVLPVVGLRTLYGLAAAEREHSSGVVIKTGMRRYGVVVDPLLGQRQTGIKPLGRRLRGRRAESGSSILGNAEVALIFDGPRAARGPSSRSLRQPDHRSAAATRRNPPQFTHNTSKEGQTA